MEQKPELNVCSSSSSSVSPTMEGSNPCPICLSPIFQLSYLDQCLHKFCYKCILQWTKVVASKQSAPSSSVKCPLCKTDNFSIIHGYDGCSFQKHYIKQDSRECFVLSSAQRYRLQCHFTEPGFLDDIFDVSRYWKSGKYLQSNCWLQSWMRREIQALMQLCDLEVAIASVACCLISRMEKDSDYGAFIEKFQLQPSPSSKDLPLSGFTFAVKDIFDIAGYVTGFGNPDWARTHPGAESTAPTVATILRAGATCIGKTVMDEMAYSITGENKHYGTPINPCAADRVPGGSSSGSAVVIGADLADFSLGTDTGGSVRVPASYCGIFGFRPSHDVISTSGVTPMAQSCDTVGWFARDPVLLSRVGRALLQIPEAHTVRPVQFIIAEDCFQLSSIPTERVKQVLVHSVEQLFGGHVLKHATLGDIVKDKVPSLSSFFEKGNASQEFNIPSLAALSSAMRILQRHEFKINHGEWIKTVQPDLGPGISERVWEAVRAADENTDVCRAVKTELRAALTELLGDAGVLAIPTVPGPPPKLQTDPSTLETFRARAFSLLSIAGISGFCQVSIPLGMHDGLPVSVSLLSAHGTDGFLLSLVETLYGTLREKVESLSLHPCL